MSVCYLNPKSNIFVTLNHYPHKLNYKLKLNKMKKGSLLVCLSLFSLMAFSQNDVVQFLKGGEAGKADANKLFQAYMEPYAFALGDGLNNGWYSSAKTHSLFGFDFTVGVTGVQVPDDAKTFDINKLGLTNIVVKSGGNIAPTVAGESDSRPLLSVKNSPIEFNSPQGTGMDIVPVPLLQVGFGLLPHTDIIGRFVPEMKYDNNGDEMKIGFWGIGAKHNFMEWIPVLNKLPFDASLFGSYSEVNGQSELNSLAIPYIEFANDGKQLLKINTKTTKLGLVVSKKFSIITVFGGIGQSTSKSNIDLVGKYTIVTTFNVAGQEVTTRETLTDPVDVPFKTSNISLDAGLRVKITLLSLFASINKSEYTSLNVGLSLGFR